jgi:hypothetical protein
MLIIYITGKPNLHGHKRREFVWSEAHGLYLYEGKELAADAFNAAYERCMRNNADMNPRVRVVVGSVPAAAPASPVVKVAIVPAPPQPRAITLEEAEATMARLAPERLKKKTGPRPPNMATLEVA